MAFSRQFVVTPALGKAKPWWTQIISNSPRAGGGRKAQFGDHVERRKSSNSAQAIYGSPFAARVRCGLSAASLTSQVHEGRGGVHSGWRAAAARA